MYHIISYANTILCNNEQIYAAGLDKKNCSICLNELRKWIGY